MKLQRYILYLQVASLGGDHQDVRVELILHGQQLVVGGAVGTELEGRAGATDLPFMSHVAELVELAVVIGDVVSLESKDLSARP